MNATEIIVCIVAIALVALDVILRLVIMPHRRDQWFEELMDSLVEPAPAKLPSIATLSDSAALESLGENLLRHFEQSSISRNVLELLASQDAGMGEKDVLSAINRQRTERRKRELPAAVVRKVVMVLMGADFVALRNGSLRITSAGRHLHELLNERTAGVVTSPAFASL